MAENLYLRLSTPAQAEGPWLEWMLLDENSGIVRFKGEGSVEEFRQLRADLSYSGRAYVMIPGEDVLLTSALVPSKQSRQILQAVPFMVEEQIASDVESCHFAIGPKLEGGDVSVAVIDDKLMSHWLEVLRDLSIKPILVTTDLLAVNDTAGCHVFVDNTRALIRTGSNTGLCVSHDMIATTIGLLQLEPESQIQFSVAAGQEANLQLIIDQIKAETELAVDLVEMEYSPFETLARQFNRGAINLLQGEFKVEDQQKKESSAWRSVAILAGCALLLHLFTVLGQAIYLDVKARQLDADARALYAQIYPNDRNVRDMRRRWQNHLRASGSGVSGEFMSLFVETTKHIPGANLNLSNVNYSDSRGDLILQLEAGRSEQLIGFAETLNKMGLEAEIGTINQADNAVRGSVKVKMAGGS